jgi:hypothetical protein
MLTYKRNDKFLKLTGEHTPEDYTMKDANEEIDLFTIEKAKKIVLETVRGNFTIQDAITQEINFHQQMLKDCTVLGFGNSCRLAVHCIRIFTKLSEIESIPLTISDGNTQQTETKAEQETPETFESLFYNKNFVNPCINILKEVDPPLIDGDCNFIGNLKSGIVIWINEMQRQAVIKSNFPQERKLLALLIPQKIKRFSIDESMFSKHSKRAESQYRIDIKAMVSKIKHSQNSQTESRES